MSHRILLALALAALVSPPLSAADTPDAIYYNGKILTTDANFKTVSALAIAQSRLTATGDNDSIRKLAGPGTKLVDLQGRTVIPGLIDNHLHFMRDAMRWENQARIDGVTSRKAALDIIAAKARSLKPGEPVLVLGGWGEQQFADQPGAFTKEELDRAAPQNPVVVQKSYMAVYLNTLAEKKTQGGASTSGGNGSSGRRYGNGNGGPGQKMRGPSRGGGGGESGGGMEMVNRTVQQFVPSLSEAQALSSLKHFCLYLNSLGLTTVYDVGRDTDGPMENVEKLQKSGELTLRAFHTLRYSANNPAQVDQALQMIRQARPLQMDDWHGIIGIGEHTYNPIHDSGMRASEYSAEDYQQFAKLARAAAAGGWHIQEHAMQDATIRQFLDVFEKIQPQASIARWTLAHCDTMTPASLARAKKLGLTLAIHNKTVKPAGRDGDSPILRQIQDSGIIWGLGSDGGVVAPINPFSTLWWVVTGKIYPDHKAIQGTISREAALIAHTRANAYLLFKEKDLGSLEPGKLADFLVLDQDYLTIPADEIRNLKPVMTVVGGKLVYSRP